MYLVVPDGEGGGKPCSRTNAETVRSGCGVCDRIPGRLGIAREEPGSDLDLMIDSNQVWEVDRALSWVRELAQFRPRWINFCQVYSCRVLQRFLGEQDDRVRRAPP
jgi:Enolase C-terminal domain-like